MTQVQAQWAATHDWYIRAEYEAVGVRGYVVEACTTVYDSNGDVDHIDAIITADIDELREWAGY